MRKMKYKLPRGVKLEIDDYDAERKDRQDSAFYTWGDSHRVATLTYKEREYYVECVGEMRIIYKGDVLRYCDRLIKAGIKNDKDLAKIEENGAEWINNSWFEVYDERSGEYTGEVYHEVKDAIETVANWIIAEKEEANV